MGVCVVGVKNIIICFEIWVGIQIVEVGSGGRWWDYNMLLGKIIHLGINRRL